MESETVTYNINVYEGITYLGTGLTHPGAHGGFIRVFIKIGGLHRK